MDRETYIQRCKIDRFLKLRKLGMSDEDATRVVDAMAVDTRSFDPPPLNSGRGWIEPIVLAEPLRHDPPPVAQLDALVAELTEVVRPTRDYYEQHDEHCKARKYHRALRAWKRTQQARAHAYDHSVEDLADEFFPEEVEGRFYLEIEYLLLHENVGIQLSDRERHTALWVP